MGKTQGRMKYYQTEQRLIKTSKTNNVKEVIITSLEDKVDLMCNKKHTAKNKKYNNYIKEEDNIETSHGNDGQSNKKHMQYKQWIKRTSRIIRKK